MKVFISWSGQESHRIAEILRDWLPMVIQSVTPFLSTVDIDRGTRWPHELGQQLEETNAAILCITGANLNSNWMHFEAGAISKNPGSIVIPYLNKLETSELTFPLAQFQVVKRERVQLRGLISSINVRSETPVATDLLDRCFEREWPALSERLAAVEVEPEAERVPARSHDDKLDEVLELVRGITRHTFPSLSTARRPVVGRRVKQPGDGRAYRVYSLQELPALISALASDDDHLLHQSALANLASWGEDLERLGINPEWISVVPNPRGYLDVQYSVDEEVRTDAFF